MTIVKVKNFRYQTVADDLRSKILTEYRPGQLLAPERDLARQYDISHMTLRKVLDILAGEGVVQRYRSRGTVVVDRLATGEFAIVLRPLLLAPEASPYYRMTSTAIMDAIHAENSNWNVRMHLGKATKTGEEFAATLDLFDPPVVNNLRGIFSFHPFYGREAELEQTRIPVVMVGGVGNPYRVQHDGESFPVHAMTHLREVGCRSVGVFWCGYSRYSPRKEVIDRMSQVAKACGLECRPEWLPYFEGDLQEKTGYELFMEFWRQSERPDGIIVSDDILCRGLLRAVLHLGIRLPEDLRLVSMANRGVEFPYHLPVTRFEYNPLAQAKAAVAMMMTLIQGKVPEQPVVTLPGVLIKGATT